MTREEQATRLLLEARGSINNGDCKSIDPALPFLAAILLALSELLVRQKVLEK